MLEFAGEQQEGQRVSKKIWIRGISVGLAGILGGYVLPNLLPHVPSWLALIGVQPDVAGAAGGLTLSSVQNSISDQPLLWYRLLPNATYKPGILLGLAIAVLPLVITLVYLSAARRWVLNTWQKLGLILPLLAFLAVGLIVSVKIGGGATCITWICSLLV